MGNLLSGKRALVTGGASGIGLAIVEKFLNEGARVSVFDMRHPGLDVIARTTAYQVDITDESVIENCMRQVLLHPLDILVNNAGIDVPIDLTNFDRKVFRKILETNLEAPAFLAATAATYMRNHGIPGSIINIASVHIRQAFPGGAGYDSSKHGLVGFSRVLALEYGRYGIRCNTVDPGFTYPTGITMGLSSETVVDFANRIPLGRPTTPEDIAEIVAFLASDKAANITGASIPVDGGLPLKSALF